MLNYNISSEVIMQSCKKTLTELDSRDANYYKRNMYWKPTERMEKAEIEHLRNAIIFWEQKLKDEV